MKHPILTTIAVLASLGSLCAKPGPEVLIVSDVLHDVPVAVRPEPGKPIHYLLLGNAENDLGYPTAFMPRPDPKAMEAELIKVLASQGFLRTKVGGPMPQIALVFSWGTSNFDPTFGQLENHEPEYDPSDFDEPGDNPKRIGRPKINRRLVGADKIRNPDLTLVEGNRITENIFTNRVFITVFAFDMPSLARKKKSVLWRTSMSVESTNHALPDSFALMLAGAAPWFGRSTAKPVFIDDHVRQTRVTLGEMQVIETVPDPTAARKLDER